MSQNTSNPFSKIKTVRIIWPILIGLGVVLFMFYREFDPSVFTAVNVTWISVLFFILAIFMMVIRDFGYMVRIRILCYNQLSWYQAFRIIMLWEFTSAITPSAIGGTSVAILYLNKEGISLGQSSAVVMATSFLDELYFIIMFPLLIAVVGGENLFTLSGQDGSGFSFGNEFFYFALLGYTIKFIYTGMVGYGLFVNPRGLKFLLLWLFRLPIIRRWRHQANEAGNEIILSSNNLKREPFSFWIKAFAATFVSWTARYWVVNVIFLAFFTVQNHFLIFARQLVMWIMMLISPTPGGSGFSEYVFTRFLDQFIPVSPTQLGSVIIVLALLWRLISYYPYLIIGVFVFPKWLKEKFGKTSVNQI